MMRFGKILFISLISVIIIQAQKVSDFGNLYPATVCSIVYPKTTQEVQAAIAYALKHDLKISIAGVRHSQGGQTNAKGSLNIDMTQMNQLIDLDVEKKLVRVQAGMSWEQLQDLLHPHDLSVKVMQASNIFSIGGSLSVNVHGRDPLYGAMIETIKSCTLVDCFGKIHELDRKSDAKLFDLVVGGYGLFGVVIEVVLEVAENCVCRKNKKTMAYQNYPNYLCDVILKNSSVQLHYARLVNIPGKNYLQKVVSLTYFKTHEALPKTELLPEKNIEKNQKLFDMARQFWGKVFNKIRWFFEENVSVPWEKVHTLTRNHAMRPYVKCLYSKSQKFTDLLQEYFIPVESFVYFTDQLRSLSEQYEIRLMNVTLRWTPKDHESFLSYGQKDTIAFVLYFSIKPDEVKKIKKYSQSLIDACLKTGGSFYLPYQRFATKCQLLQSYPMLPKFVEEKKKYDPLNLFISSWYQDYILPATL